MIRRTVLLAAAAASLVLIPSAAMAYDAPGYTTELSDPTPALGATSSITVNGPNPNENITLVLTSDPTTISSDDMTIAGTKSLTKAANAQGVSVFQVTLSAAGVFTATATTPSGAVIGTHVLTVVAAASPSGSGSALPTTGFDGLPLVAGAGALVLVGAGVVVYAKRRGSTKVHV